MQKYTMPRDRFGCGALPLQNVGKTRGKMLLLHTFFGQICQGAVLVNFIDIFAIWSIIDSV